MKPTPPLRLSDDPNVPSILRDDLARAADRSTTPFDAVQGLAAFEAALGKGGPGAPPSPRTATGSATPKLAGALAKGALCGILAVGAAGLVSNLQGRRDGASVSTVATSAAPPAEPAVAPPANPPTPPEPPSTLSTAMSPPVRPGVSVTSATSAASAPSAASASALQLEMDLLGRMRALEPSDPQQALALAEEGRRRFSPGIFAQERETLAIAALARLGRRSEAKARARAFLAAYPHSHFVERIRELTGE